MTDVEWPGRRGDVVAALEVLSTISPETVETCPGRLTDAVHWLLDDTGWDIFHSRKDHRNAADLDPAKFIGLILRDDTEVAAINAVIVPLLAVLDELGPIMPDVDYLIHPRWPEVAANANTTHHLMTGIRPR